MTLHSRRDRAVTARLDRLFGRSLISLAPTIPIRKTVCGLWVPTPLSVIDGALARLTEIGVLPRHKKNGASFVDAGTGDGRLSVCLARIDPSWRVLGVERDPVLFAHAESNLQRIRAERIVDVSGVTLTEADYCDPSTYERSRVDLHAVDIVFNYPDGNETRLARLMERHGHPSTHLCVLTHNRALTLPGLTLRVHTVVTVRGHSRWHLSIYGTG